MTNPIVAHALTALALPALLMSTSAIPAHAVQESRENDCGTMKLELEDKHQPPGIVRVSVTIRGNGRKLSSATWRVFWQNSVHPEFPHGEIPGSDFADPEGFIVRSTAIQTKTGWVAGKLVGVAFLEDGTSCVLPATNAWTTVGEGQWNSAMIPVPETADLNGDGENDDKHCESCDKRADELDELEMERLRDKVCEPISKTKSKATRDACKKSGLAAIRAREGRGFTDCWYRVNRSGWVGPTAPENAPKGYRGVYFGDCGFKVPKS